MYKKSFLKPILFGLIAVLFASCDKDYNELGTDIVDDEHFGFERYIGATIKSYNQKLGPVASNNLAINPLGFYTNPAFGTTQANFVTQLEMATQNPTFNNTDPDDYDVNPTAIDSVVMTVPYFSHVQKNVTLVDDVKPYILDSIYGGKPDESKFKLSIYQSNYFLRDLDPSQALIQPQAFYNDENSVIENNTVGAPLNDLPMTDPRNSEGQENSAFFFDKNEHETSTIKDGTVVKDPRTPPSMRIHLNNAVFTNLILNAPEGKLLNNAVFKNYFRGLYFKVENIGNQGHMAMLNFKGGKITIYYNEDKKKSSSGTTPVWERVNKTFVLNMTGNCVSLLQNSGENTDYLNAANSPTEASKLYLKGGEGSVAMLDLFGDPASSNYDTYKYVVKKNTAGKPVDENGNEIFLDSDGKPLNNKFLLYLKVNTPNGIADELDELRYPAHFSVADEPSQIHHSEKNRWMINEANLTFNIATGDMLNEASIEPMRIYVYDLTNNKPVVDYTYDLTTNALFPKFNKGVFGGLLFDANGKIFKQKDDTGKFDKKGAKYKIRLTNHIRNLIRNDSTNVRLGVSVTESIANIGFAKLKNPNSNFKYVPGMSVMSPTGTILYGTNPAISESQRLKLEIYYTKPD